MKKGSRNLFIKSSISLIQGSLNRVSCVLLIRIQVFHVQMQKLTEITYVVHKLQIQQSGAHPFWIFFLLTNARIWTEERKILTFFQNVCHIFVGIKNHKNIFLIFISSYTIFGYLFISRFPAIYALIYLLKFLFEFFFPTRNRSWIW